MHAGNLWTTRGKWPYWGMRTDGPDHDAGDLPDWAAGLRVPDDARELDADLYRWRREQQAIHRRARSLRRRRPIAFAAGVCLLSLLVATGTGLIATMLPSAPDTTRHAAALATVTRAAPGDVGGLLPDVTLRLGDRPVRARAVRPALLGLLPAHCGCQRIVNDLAAQAAEFGVPLVLVTSGNPDSDLAGDPAEGQTLAAATHRGTVEAAYDEQAALSTGYGARGVTAVVVADDGVVTAVARSLAPPLRLEPLLTRAYLGQATSA